MKNLAETRIGIECQSTTFITSYSAALEVLSELGRATTAYHEALPHRVEHARVEYEEALRKFNAVLEAGAAPVTLP